MKVSRQQKFWILFGVGVWALLAIGFVIGMHYLQSCPLNDAAVAGDLERVKKIVEGGVPPDQTCVQYLHFPPLLSAVDAGHRPVVEYLIAKGADVNKRALLGMNALSMATDEEHAELIPILMKAGAKHVADETGNFPIHDATAQGFVKVVRALLDGGADINAKNSDGQTALHLAVEAESEEIVALILERRPKLDEIDNEGRSPLYLALSLDLDTLAALLKKAGAEIADLRTPEKK